MKSPTQKIIVIPEEELLEKIRSVINEELTRNSISSNTDSEKPLSPKEASEIFNVSRQTLYSWIKKGHIPSRLIGGRRYFFMSDIKKHLDK